MREILFRGKETQGNKWAYGSLVEFNERTFLSDNNLAHKVPSEMWNFHTFEGFCEVIPSTVGQYTGLTDKNGTKIFEGDILKHGYFNRYCREKLTAKYIVKWGKCGFGISLACITEQDICEVIGNIHEEVQNDRE